MFQRIDLLDPSTAAATRMPARVPAPATRTRRAESHPALALPVLVAQDPCLGAADHLQVQPAPVAMASRLGVPDLRRRQFPHRFILAFIPGFAGASSGTIAEVDGTAEWLNFYHPVVISDNYGTPRNDDRSRTGRSDLGRASRLRGTPEPASGLPSPEVTFPSGRRRRSRPTLTTPRESVPRRTGRATHRTAFSRCQGLISEKSSSARPCPSCARRDSPRSCAGAAAAAPRAGRSPR